MRTRGGGKPQGWCSEGRQHAQRGQQVPAGNWHIHDIMLCTPQGDAQGLHCGSGGHGVMSVQQQQQHVWTLRRQTAKLAAGRGRTLDHHASCSDPVATAPALTDHQHTKFQAERHQGPCTLCGPGVCIHHGICALLLPLTCVLTHPLYCLPLLEAQITRVPVQGSHIRVLPAAVATAASTCCCCCWW